MGGTNDLSKSKQIRNLLLVIGSAVALSFAAMFLMLYSYGPAGTYLAKNVLLSPDSTEVLYINQSNSKQSKGKHPSPLVFDSIQFSHYDAQQHKFINTALSKSTYANIYQLIEHDISLLENPQNPEIPGGFNQVGATLIFKIKSEEGKQPNSLNLFEVDFAKDYYRISLREQNTDQQWAYFKHPNILEQVLKILQNDNNST